MALQAFIGHCTVNVGIGYLMQEKRGSRHRSAGGAPVAAVDYLLESIGREFAAANVHERSYYGSYHVA